MSSADLDEALAEIRTMPASQIFDAWVQGRFHKMSTSSTADEFEILGAYVARAVMERETEAYRLAESLLKLPDRQVRRQAVLTLRCDNGCVLTMIFGRRHLTHPMSPPNNELAVAWTTRGWRADLSRWYIPDRFFETSRTIQTACKHGAGLIDKHAVFELVVHAGPDSTEPETVLPYGAVRRLSDEVSPGETLESFALRGAWQPHRG